jgi:hypothetical protein
MDEELEFQRNPTKRTASEALGEDLSNLSCDDEEDVKNGTLI